MVAWWLRTGVGVGGVGEIVTCYMLHVTLGSTNLRQVFDNQEINMKNICSVQIK